MQCLVGCSLLREPIMNPPSTEYTESRFNRRMKHLFTEMRKLCRQQPWNPQLSFDEICTLSNCEKFRDKTQQDAGNSYVP